MKSKISESISEFLDFLRISESKYHFCVEKVDYYNRLREDDIHDIELSAMNYKERAKFATAMRKHLLNRRKYKDEIAILKPLIDFMADPTNKRVIDKLTQTLGAVRKEEKHLETRTYNRRVKEIKEEAR